MFALNLTLKLLCVTVADADIGSLKSLHTFLQKHLYPMLLKCEQNRVVLTTRYLRFLTKNKTKQKQTNKAKMDFLKPCLIKFGRHLEICFCS